MGKAQLCKAHRGRPQEVNLKGANLKGAKLQDVRLHTARLLETTFDCAIITGAALWGIHNTKWSIKGIICEYAYWDEEAKEKIHYKPGEFERLFADRAIIKLHYKDGIRPLEVVSLQAFIQHLSDTHHEVNLRLVSIHEDGGGAVVELAIEDTYKLSVEQVKQLQATLQKEAQQKVELQRLTLAEKEMRLQLEGEVKQLTSVVDKMLKHMGDTYNINGQVGAAGKDATASGNTLNQKKAARPTRRKGER